MRLLTVATVLVMARAAPGIGQAPSPIRWSRLVARTDSFVVMIQGNALGFQRTSVERTEHGVRVVDDVEIGPIMSQHTEIELGTGGVMRSTRQRGRVRGQNAGIDIAYADGRARGTATTPSLSGVVTTAIDTIVSAGVVDDNLITALLPLLDWSPGGSFTLPVFLSGKGVEQPITFAVKGIESVSVPAGTFDVYRVEMSGGQATVAMYLTSEAPHRLVKIAPRGAPLEFVLAAWVQSPRVVPVTTRPDRIAPR